MKSAAFVAIFQRVAYYVDKTGLGVKKEVTNIVWEYKGPVVPTHSTMKLDNLSQVGTCALIQILRLCSFMKYRFNESTVYTSISGITTSHRV